MNNTKTERRYFSVPEWKKEESYLREQHKNGWKFVKVSGFCVYHFEKCIPEDVIYRLDYNQDGISHKEEYVKMFNDCGWEYLQDYVGYSYFRKAASDTDGEEEIFCDDASRLDMMKRVFRGRLVPLLTVFFLIIIPQMIMLILIDTPWGRFLSILYGIMFAMYLGLFISFAIQYRKYYRSVHKE